MMKEPAGSDGALDWQQYGLEIRSRSRPLPSHLNRLIALYPALPQDYLAFISLSNGADVGDVSIWDIDTAVATNEDQSGDAPGGLFLFGSWNGRRYGFDLRPGCKKAVVEFFELFSWEYAGYVAPTFSHMLRLEQLRSEWLEAELETEDIFDHQQNPAFSEPDLQNQLGPNALESVKPGLRAWLARLVKRQR